MAYPTIIFWTLHLNPKVLGTSTEASCACLHRVSFLFTSAAMRYIVLFPFEAHSPKNLLKSHSKRFNLPAKQIEYGFRMG